MADRQPPDLDRWATEARDDATIAERARVASLRRQLAGDTTLSGLLVDLVEGRRPVVLGVAGDADAPLLGTVEAVGPDHLRLRSPNGELALVALVHLRWVRGAPGRPIRAAGDRRAGPAGPLAAVLHTLAEEGAQVRLRTAEGAAVDGRLLAVGPDVVVVDHGVHGPTYVALVAVAVVWPDAR